MNALQLKVCRVYKDSCEPIMSPLMAQLAGLCHDSAAWPLWPLWPLNGPFRNHGPFGPFVAPLAK